MSTPAPGVSVVTTTWNEKDNIVKLIPRLRQVLQHLSHEIIVIDDGSQDGTSQAAVQAGADIVIAHQRNMGVAIAYKTAIDSALNFGADIICTIDADGQFDPSEMNQLIEKINMDKHVISLLTTI